jgi:hypothetical protein
VIYVAPLVRLLPLAFMGRLGIAFVEIVLATLVISTSVVVGHDLKAWRAWYWDPSTIHPWLPTSTPTNVIAALPQVATVAVATSSVATRVPTPPPPCGAAASGAQLVFVRPAQAGRDCVWFTHEAAGWHVVVDTRGTVTDIGVISLAAPQFDVYSPSAAAAPILVVSGTAGADAANVVVFTWQTRGMVELFRAGGRRLDVHADSEGWPRIEVTRAEGTSLRARLYVWDGKTYVESIR